MAELADLALHHWIATAFLFGASLFTLAHSLLFCSRSLRFLFGEARSLREEFSREASEWRRMISRR